MNRFDNPKGQQYVSQRVPLPLDFIAGMAKDYSDKYNKAKEETYALDDLMSKVNAIDEHSQYKKQLNDQFHPRIEDLASRMAKGIDLNTATSEINKLKRDFQNNELRQELENSYIQKNEYLKERRKLGAEYDFVEDPNYSFKGTKDGQLESFRFQGMGKIQDHQKRAQEMMKDIASSGYDNNNTYIGKDGNVYRSVNGKEELATAQIWSIAQSKSPDFQSTLEGKNLVKHILHDMPNISQKDLDNQVTQYLFNAGLQQAHIKTKTGGGFEQFKPRYLAEQEAANNTTSTQSEGLTNTEVPDLVKSMQFDSKGNLKIPDQTGFVDTGTGKGTTGTMGTSGLSQAKGKDVNKMAEQVKFIENIKTNHPELKDLSPKQVIETYNKALTSLTNESIPLESISNVASKNIGEAISRNKNQRNFYVWDGKGKTTDGTLQTVLKELDINEEDFDKALKNGIGGYTQAGPNAGSYYVEVKNDDDETRRVMISPDQEMQKIFRTSQALNIARKSLTQTTVSPFEELPNYKILVNPKINKDGKINWEYVEIITDENGQPIKSNKTTLDDIRLSEKNRLQQSGYLGSNLGVLKNDTTE